MRKNRITQGGEMKSLHLHFIKTPIKYKRG